MAYRQRIDQVSILKDRENATARMAGKATLQPTKGLVQKRPALGELGNKIHAQNKTDGIKNVSKVMGPPQPTQIKPTVKTSGVTFRDNEKKNVKTTKSVLTREESILKNFPARKEDVSVPKVQAYSAKQLTILDPDESTKNEPQMVTEYLQDIFAYLRDLETKYEINKNHLEGSKSTPKMRSILVNWIMEVHLSFKFCLETLHLTISIVDRYLQINKNVGRDSLQLVGTSALLIASKYEEMYLPELDDYVYICDETFSRRQILQMEIDILKKLDFNLGRPHSIQFLRRYSKIGKVQIAEHTLAKYLLELVLLEYEMAHEKPSLQAAAACCLSVAILNDTLNPAKVWSPTMAHYTTHEYSDIKPLVIGFAHLLVKSKTSKHQTTYKKYATSANMKISVNPKLDGLVVRKLTEGSAKK